MSRSIVPANTAMPLFLPGCETEMHNGNMVESV